MRSQIRQHWAIFASIGGQKVLKYAIYCWAFVGAYDLVVSQFLSKEWSEKSPRIYEFLSMTSGWLPWWAWGWIGTAIFAVAVFEYAVKLHLRLAIEPTTSTFSENDQKESRAIANDLLTYLSNIKELIQKHVSSEADILELNNSFVELKEQIIAFVEENISRQWAYDLSHPSLSIVVWSESAFNDRHNTLMHEMRVFEDTLANIQRSQVDLEDARNRTRG